MDTYRTIQELKKGAKSWNRWRKSFAEGEINLDGIELNGVDLDHVDLSKVSMRNSTITNCRFRFSDLFPLILKAPSYKITISLMRN